MKAATSIGASKNKTLSFFAIASQTGYLPAMSSG
jgi:hypothetical protein